MYKLATAACRPSPPPHQRPAMAWLSHGSCSSPGSPATPPHSNESPWECARALAAAASLQRRTPPCACLPSGCCGTAHSSSARRTARRGHRNKPRAGAALQAGPAAGTGQADHTLVRRTSAAALPRRWVAAAPAAGPAMYAPAPGPAAPPAAVWLLLPPRRQLHLPCRLSRTLPLPAAPHQPGARCGPPARQVVVQPQPHTRGSCMLSSISVAPTP